MTARTVLLLPVLVLTTVLGGCGGGGTDATSVVPAPAPVAPAPTPTPTPTPTPSAALPPAPFNLTAGAQFAMVGWQQTSQGTGYSFALAQQIGKLAWSPELKTYAIDLAGLAAGRLIYTFPPGPGGNPAAFSILQADGTKAKVNVSLFAKTGAAGEFFWQTADGVQPFVYARAIFGLSTGDLPTAGRREFVTDTATQSSIVVDFATRKVTGSVTSFHDGGGWDPEGPKERAILEPADLLPDGSFVATVAVTGAPTNGELHGRLFGTAGNELGVYWNAPARDGYNSFVQWQAVMLYPLCSICSS